MARRIISIMYTSVQAVNERHTVSYKRGGVPAPVQSPNLYLDLSPLPSMRSKWKSLGWRGEATPDKTKREKLSDENIKN